MRVAPEIELVTPGKIKELQMVGMNRKPRIFADSRKISK
jgi:hypothetical protein